MNFDFIPGEKFITSCSSPYQIFKKNSDGIWEGLKIHTNMDVICEQGKEVMQSEGCDMIECVSIKDYEELFVRDMTFLHNVCSGSSNQMYEKLRAEKGEYRAEKMYYTNSRCIDNSKKIATYYFEID